MLSAKELADPNLDHLSLMSYLSKFQSVQPRKSKAEWLQIRFNFDNIRTGNQVRCLHLLLSIYCNTSRSPIFTIPMNYIDHSVIIC